MSGPDADDISTIEEEEVRKGGQSDASVSPKPARAAFDHGVSPIGGVAVDDRRTTKSRCARCGDALERCLETWDEEFMRFEHGLRGFKTCCMHVLMYYVCLLI